MPGSAAAALARFAGHPRGGDAEPDEPSEPYVFFSDDSGTGADGESAVM